MTADYSRLVPSLRERLYSRGKRTAEGCLEFTGYIHPTGYGQIGSGQRNVLRCHRAAWVLEYGQIPDGLWVLHHCDNRKCFNVEHLYLGTCKDNTRDMISRGRDRKALGIKSSNGRLTWEQVQDIRRRHVKGRAAGHGVKTGNTRELAEEFGVCKQYILDLVREDWRKVC